MNAHLFRPNFEGLKYFLFKEVFSYAYKMAGAKNNTVAC